jgi:REP element-mobilizing transposase RayT
MKWKNLPVSTTFFIRATITEWQSVLAQPYAREILLNDFNFYREKYHSKIFAYVIMPEHYHLLLELQQPHDLSGWLHDYQKHTANELSKWLHKAANQNELETYARHANGSAKLAIWKEQARAVPIISERSLRTKIEYIHKNPVSRGLISEPKDWLWSSWRNYYMDDDSVFRVDKVDL